MSDESGSESGSEAMDAMSGQDMFDIMSSMDVPGKTPDSLQEEELLSDDEEVSEDDTVISSPKDDNSDSESVEEDLKQPEALSDVPSFKAKVGDKEVDVPEEATFKIRVDNQDVEVSAKELVRNYQGKIPLEKHYKESKEMRASLDRERDQIKRDVQILDSELSEVLKTFETNPYLAFEKIAEMKGKNPADYLPIFIAQSKQTIKELDTLSDAEYKALVLQRKLEHNEKQLDRKARKLEEQEKGYNTKMSQADADRYFTEQAVAKGFTNEEIQESVDLIQEAGLDLTQMEPKQVADLIIADIEGSGKKHRVMNSAIQKVDPSLKSDNQFYQLLSQYVDSSLTESDVVEIITAVTGKQPKALAPKMQSSQSESSKGSSTEGQPSPNRTTPQKEEKQKVGEMSLNQTSNYFSIDDILKEYGH